MEVEASKVWITKYALTKGWGKAENIHSCRPDRIPPADSEAM